MLEYLRNAADKPVAKILIGILAFSFVGWGVAEWIFGGAASDTTLVRVGNADVTIQQFSLEKSRELAAMTREQQREVYADPIKTQALNKQVMTTLTTQAMADNRAADLGFVVSDAQIAREIRAFPEFQIDGQFSTFAFDSVLANSGDVLAKSFHPAEKSISSFMDSTIFLCSGIISGGETTYSALVSFNDGMLFISSLLLPAMLFNSISAVLLSLSDTEWLVRLSVKPLASWLWLSAALMMMAGVLLCVRRRKEKEKNALA